MKSDKKIVFWSVLIVMFLICVSNYVLGHPGRWYVHAADNWANGDMQSFYKKYSPLTLAHLPFLELFSFLNFLRIEFVLNLVLVFVNFFLFIKFVKNYVNMSFSKLLFAVFLFFLIPLNDLSYNVGLFFMFLSLYFLENEKDFLFFFFGLISIGIKPFIILILPSYYLLKKNNEKGFKFFVPSVLLFLLFLLQITGVNVLELLFLKFNPIVFINRLIDTEYLNYSLIYIILDFFVFLKTFFVKKDRMSLFLKYVIPSMIFLRFVDPSFVISYGISRNPALIHWTVYFLLPFYFIIILRPVNKVLKINNKKIKLKNVFFKLFSCLLSTLVIISVAGGIRASSINYVESITSDYYQNYLESAYGQKLYPFSDTIRDNDGDVLIEVYGEIDSSRYEEILEKDHECALILPSSKVMSLTAMHFYFIGVNNREACDYLENIFYQHFDDVKDNIKMVSPFLYDKYTSPLTPNHNPYYDLIYSPILIHITETFFPFYLFVSLFFISFFIPEKYFKKLVDRFFL